MADEQVIELTIRLRVVLQVSVEAVAESTGPTGHSVGAMSVSVAPKTPKLPQLPLADCMSCGFTDAECRAVIDLTQAGKSCCATCKNTNTHPPLPQTDKEV